MILTVIARRIVFAIPSLLGVATLIFILGHLTPGDPAVAALGLDSESFTYVTEEDLIRVREELGLNQPLIQQYVGWIWRAVQGDFGRSYVQSADIAEMILKALPTTLMLISFTMVVAIVTGMAIGILSAVYRGRAGDIIARMIAIIGVSTPTFWFALILIWTLAYQVPIFPMNGPVSDHGLIAMVLPTLAIALHPAALIARMMRSSMLDVLSQDMIRTATAKGLTRRRVFLGHALRNALNPVITVVGFQLANLIGGAVAIEFIFSLPGLGSLLIDSIVEKDILVLQATVLVIGVAFILSNLVVDLLYLIVDPRVRA
jgi:peptide/nickel transport system permease protein